MALNWEPENLVLGLALTRRGHVILGKSPSLVYPFVNEKIGVGEN